MPQFSSFSLQPHHTTSPAPAHLPVTFGQYICYRRFSQRTNPLPVCVIQSGPSSQHKQFIDRPFVTCIPSPSQQYSRKSFNLCSIPLPLLDLLQRLHGAMQRVLVVSSELRVCTFEGRVSVGFGLVDARGERLLVLVLLIFRSYGTGRMRVSVRKRTYPFL